MNEVASSTNPLASDKEKNSEAYGLRLLKAAINSWNIGGINGEGRASRKARFDYNRSYGLGKYDMNEFKDILDLDGQISIVNLPYDPLNIAKTFLNRLKDRYNQRDEIIECTAVDPFITQKKKSAQDNALFKLKHKQEIQQVQQNSGVQTEEFGDFDLDTEADIKASYGYNYKEREEIIMENLINIVFYENSWNDVIKDRIMDDLIYCGYAGTKTYIDGTGRIKIKFIKPENLITSYSEWNDFRDWQYLGEAYYLSIMEVRLLYPGKIGEKELYELSQTLVGQYGNPSSKIEWKPYFTNSIARPYDAWRVPLAEVSFKTLYNIDKNLVTDKYGKEIVASPEYTINGKIVTDAKPLTSNPYYVEYTGVCIMDTEYVLQWGLSKNMVKPENNLQEIISPFTLYMYDNTEMTNKPLMEMIIPHIKKMTIYELQQLKIVAAAAPDGYDIDVALMSDISLDGGQSIMSPVELYTVYKQTGIRYYKSIPDEGIEGGQRRVPIQANNVPFSSKLEELGNLKGAELLAITNLISNEIDAGNIRNQAITQNTVEEAKKTGESTSNYIYNSFLNIMQRTAKVVQMRGWDLLQYGKKFGIQYYDGYRQALGTNRIEYLKAEATDDWSKSAFDVQIKTIIGDKDAMFLENNLENALKNQAITLADAIDVREYARTNIKWASYVLAQRLDKRAKQKQAEAMALSQQNTQSVVAGAQAKTQGEMQLAGLQEQNKAADDLRTRETQLVVEQEKFASILKVEIAKSILAVPGKTMADIPSFVFEGLPMAKALDHAALMQYLQTMQEASQVQGAQAQQQSDPNQQQPTDQSSQQNDPSQYVDVELPDGRTGRVPHHRLNELVQKHPQAKVLA